MLSSNFYFYFLISKLPVQCTDNFMIFYVRQFWIMLYIYYKEKIK